jgi:hypothetical protein
MGIRGVKTRIKRPQREARYRLLPSPEIKINTLSVVYLILPFWSLPSCRSLYPSLRSCLVVLLFYFCLPFQCIIPIPAYLSYRSSFIFVVFIFFYINVRIYTLCTFLFSPLSFHVPLFLSFLNLVIVSFCRSSSLPSFLSTLVAKFLFYCEVLA